MKTKVGASGWTGDPRARFTVAVPSAIAITALCFALGRCQPAERTLGERTVASTVVLERAAPTPVPPTPRPTPPPTLPPIAKVTLAPVPERAAPRAIHPSGGGHAAPLSPPRITQQKAVIVAGSGGGAGPGAGDGEGAGDSGGSGNGTGGTGSGSVNADAPCGSVDLIPFQSPDRNGSTTFEHVQATVTFPDGHQQTEEFPYRWSYTDPGADPWSPRNMPNANFITRVQLPPPSANVGRFPEVIRYILNHTREDGTTVLQECPRQR
jgi:hypothetical protein